MKFLFTRIHKINFYQYLLIHLIHISPISKKHRLFRLPILLHATRLLALRQAGNIGNYARAQSFAG